MANPGKPVRIHWIPAEEHGRKTPPIGPTYFATIRLDKSEQLQDEWSVRLESLHSEGRDCSRAVISFVSDKAPASVLAPGVRFQLFEGRWPVASGQVLSTPVVGNQVQPDVFRESLQLLRESHFLAVAGKDEGSEADAVREAMERLWWRLSETEQQRLEGLSADLHSIGENRAVRAAVPNEIAKACKAAIASANWDRALTILREHESELPPHEVAAMRGVAWGHFGRHEIASLFFAEASRLKPDGIALKCIYLRTLVRAGQPVEAREQALHIAKTTADSLELLLAADVLFDCLDWHLGSAPEAELRQIVQIAARGIKDLRDTPTDSWRSALVSSALFSKALCHELLGEASEAIAAAAQAEQLVPLPPASAVATQVVEAADGHGSFRRHLQERRRMLHDATSVTDPPLCAA